MGNQVSSAKNSFRSLRRKRSKSEEQEEYTKEDIQKKYRSIPQLTQEEKQVLKSSWLLITDKLETVGAHTFLELFNAYPDSQNAFTKFRGMDLSFTPELAKHGTRVMLVVDKVIANIDNFDRVWELLLGMGRKHFNYGALPMYMDLMGPHFVIAIRNHLGNDFYEALEYHWLALFNIIVYIMKFGWNLQRAEEQKRAKVITEGTGAMGSTSSSDY